MAYLGNKNGPKKSDLFSHCEAAYFGISDIELAEAVDQYVTDEAAGEVVPVHRDAAGNFYITVNAPGDKTQRLIIPAEAFTGLIQVLDDGQTEPKEIEAPVPVPQ